MIDQPIVYLDEQIIARYPEISTEYKDEDAFYWYPLIFINDFHTDEEMFDKFCTYGPGLQESDETGLASVINARVTVLLDRETGTVLKTHTFPS